MYANRNLEAGDPLARAGRLACFCPPGVATQNSAAPSHPWLLAGGFGLAVLSQTLVLGVLPLAGLLLAPQARYAALPYVAMLFGAAVATFPASWLLDSFGRRASFALGASHGVAGGLVMAWALSANAFAPFCLGAFWIGVAQGFSLFYRHEAAIGSRALAAAQVFGAGALAGVAGPWVVAWAEGFLPAAPYVGFALAAALAQVGVLTLAMLSRGELPGAAPVISAGAQSWRDAAAPTVLGAAAWFGMTALMLSTPYAMIGCGIAATSVFGAMAWHVIAMYAPSLAVERIVRWTGVRALAIAGLVIIIAARLSFGSASATPEFTALLVVIAVGWCLTTTSTTIWLHQQGSPPRAVLAVHDLCLFGAAIAGALAAGNLMG